MPEIVVEVKDLVKAYGDVKAVNGISFNISNGEIFGILGPNGAGKSTTVEIIEGLRSADGGTATILGINISKNTRARKRTHWGTITKSGPLPRFKGQRNYQLLPEPL